MSSILSVTNVYDKEMKRKNRWTLKLLNIPTFNDTDPFGSDPNTNNPDIDRDGDISRILQLSLLSSARPSIELGEVEQHRLNEKFYYPEGKPNYNELPAVFYDHIGNNIGKYLSDWSRAVYDPKTGAVGYKRFFAVEGHLYMLDPKGIIVEEWTLLNCWPKSVDGGDLSYEDTGSAMWTLSFRYDKAIPKFYRDPMASFVPGVDTEGFAGDPYGIPGQNDFNQFADTATNYPGP